jgi:hypothetical protein
LFNVDKVNFVLAINRDQLIQVIVNAYGVDREDASLYLQKFVHVETNLPSLHNLQASEHKESLKQYIEDLKRLFLIPDKFLDTDKFSDLIFCMMPHVKFTPRSIERILTLFTISMDSSSIEKRERFFREILFLSVIKVETPEFYNNVKKNGSITKNPGVSASYSISTKFVDYIKNGGFFGKELIEKKQTNAVWISTLKEASKIVDIYDLPKDEKHKKEIFGKSYYKKNE